MVEVESEPLTDVDEVVARCQDDMRYLYRDVLLDGNPEYQSAVDSKLHSLLFDFLRWDECGNGTTVMHTELPTLMPEKGQTRWIHWRKLDSAPDVYDGDEHELGEKWKRGDLIRGVVIRIAGTGHNKYCLLPRYHLKTEIAHVVFALQEILRDPSVRVVSKTHTTPLAKKILTRISGSWKLDKFSRYFGELKPDLKESAWNEQYIQVRAPQRGVGHTVEASAIKVESTGSHPDIIIADDIIGFENLNERDKIRAHIESLAFALGGEGRILGIGTRYAPDDPHSLFLDYGTPLFASTSFIYATLLDDSGEPVWNFMTPEKILRIRERCSDDFVWYCQMFNNPFQVQSQKLKPEWWRRWPREEDKDALQKCGFDTTLVSPEAIAEALHLDICITLDPASSVRKKSDYSACIVQGQTQDREFRLVLDGFREKLSKDDLPGRFMDVVEHWLHHSRRIRVRFIVAVEDHGLGTYLTYPLTDQMRRRGFFVEIKPLKSSNRNKNDRIYALAEPYKLGSILYPEKMDKDNYDFIEVLKAQYLHFPRGGYGMDDILDVQAYQEELLIPRPMKSELPAEMAKALPNDVIQDKAPERRAGVYVPKGFSGQKARNGRWVPGRFKNHG